MLLRGFFLWVVAVLGFGEGSWEVNSRDLQERVVGFGARERGLLDFHGTLE